MTNQELTINEIETQLNLNNRLNRIIGKREPFLRVNVPAEEGLSSELVRLRRDAGAVNKMSSELTPSVGRILCKNIFTLFNFINAALALLLVIVGEPKNALFVSVALANTLIGAFQEIHAKKTLDKFAILGKGNTTVIRDGVETVINPDDIVLDDIVRLSAGDQIYADAIILESEGLEANESLLTGEADNVRKRAGDNLLSGSFITAGAAVSRVTAVGADSYASALVVEAKRAKTKKSQLMRMLNAIIRALTFVIIPVGALLYYMEIRTGSAPSRALLGATAAMTGMIPQGLVLLTGLTLVVGAVSLSRRKALVQSHYSIETLARADVLCLDKTGTMTDGTLVFDKLILQDEFSEEEATCAIACLIDALRDSNATIVALRTAFTVPEQSIKATVTVPFSSERKWSGAFFEDLGSVVLGAPGFVFPESNFPFFETAGQLAAEGYRVLCLASTQERLPEGGRLPEGLHCMALLVLSDNVRADASDTFQYFAEQGLTIKVISGDDPCAVSAIASRVGLPGADKAVDMSHFTEKSDLSLMVEEYTVFGRVSPRQKRDLIRALQKNGHVACMTGDGVNDVLAMKEADCSVAMVGGSGAARSVCDFVLMSSNFSAMINILYEGRRVINNIDKISSLYLVRTIYSIMLVVIYIFLPFAFPFEPVQMIAVNALVVGIPTFFLALRPDIKKPEGRFTDGLLKNSLPAAVTIVFEVLAVQAVQVGFGLSPAETSTICSFLIGSVGFFVLFTVSQPLNVWIGSMLALLAAVYILLFSVAGFIGSIFSLANLLELNASIYLTLLLAGLCLFSLLRRGACAVIGRIDLQNK